MINSRLVSSVLELDVGEQGCQESTQELPVSILGWSGLYSVQRREGGQVSKTKVPTCDCEVISEHYN